MKLFGYELYFEYSNEGKKIVEAFKKNQGCSVFDCMKCPLRLKEKEHPCMCIINQLREDSEMNDDGKSEMKFDGNSSYRKKIYERYLNYKKTTQEEMEI